MRRASRVHDPFAVAWCLLSKGIIVLREGCQGQIHSPLAERPIQKASMWGCPYSCRMSFNTPSRVLEAPGTFPGTPVFGLGVQGGQESGDLHFLLDLRFLGHSEVSPWTPEERVWGRTSRDMSPLLLKIARNIPPSRNTAKGEKL